MSVNFGQNIEQERFNIKIQSLVVKKQFGHQTQILTIKLTKQQKEKQDNEVKMTAEEQPSTNCFTGF
jgi:hypothetical protein